MKTVLSIIVPVFNVEKYITRCIENLLDQGNISSEIILVDDGSDDRSSEICLKYAYENPRIIYIRQPNNGPGAARERGLKVASGEYVFFADADDIVPSGALEKLVSIAESTGVDIVSGDIAYIDEINGRLKETVSCLRLEANRLYYVKNKPELIYLMRLFLWGKLYRKQTLLGSGVSQPNHFYEDTSVLPCIISSAEKVYHVDEVVYKYYRGRPCNTVNNLNRLKDLYLSMTEIFEYFESRGLFEQYRSALKTLLHSQIRFIVRKFENSIRCSEHDFKYELIDNMLGLMSDKFGKWFNTYGMNIIVIGNEVLKTAADCFGISGCSLHYLESDDMDIPEDSDLIIMDTSFGVEKLYEVAKRNKTVLLVDYDDGESVDFSNVTKVNYRRLSKNDDMMTYVWDLADLLFKACNE